MRGIRWEHYYWADSPELRKDFRTYGGDGSPDFWLNYGRRQLVALGTESGKAGKLAPVLNRYMTDSYRPASVVAEAAEGILSQLREAGFKLGVLSNRELPYREELDRLGIGRYFDVVMAAGEVQLYKPDPGVFEAALRQIGERPPAAMYVGDNYFADVIGARRAGLRPVLFDPRGVYPQAACDVIQSFHQLPGLLT
jgi:FMN phosphatase YigB (HAD superfamily)